MPSTTLGIMILTAYDIPKDVNLKSNRLIGN